jgi:antitoxin component of RelBE/YafQ-DinJ toxin-antitoxin module
VRTYYVVMNVTLSVGERTVRKARKVAESMGISLNQAVRRFLEELAGDDSVDADIAELNELSALSNGRSRGWRFDREAIHDRRP